MRRTYQKHVARLRVIFDSVHDIPRFALFEKHEFPQIVRMRSVGRDVLSAYHVLVKNHLFEFRRHNLSPPPRGYNFIIAVFVGLVNDLRK